MSNGKSRSLLALAGFGLATAGAVWYGSRYSRGASNDSSYRHLDKPRFTPPDNAFPMIWISLYAMIAWSGWRIWTAAPSRERKHALRLWISQLSANAKWSKLFFGEHR
ncbi:MAG: TspO/MBR family protein, partial [Candidatus Sulfotelmatobacter sp.]